MLNLNELEQFVAFSEKGTLLKVSEELNISQPTLTRNMQHVERDFGVPLFIRGKNKLELNETGIEAVRYAKKLLDEEKNSIRMVQQFDKNRRTITVESCAPAPLWVLLPKLSSKFPDNTISSKLHPIDEIISDTECGRCDIGILPFSYDSPDLCSKPYLSESLSVCIPLSHPLASRPKLTFSDLNGFNCLLRDEIGFWTELCRDKMPASKFLIQTDASELDELIRTSTLFCFTTEFGNPSGGLFNNRAIIPVTDREANVTYHLIGKNLECYL